MRLKLSLMGIVSLAAVIFLLSWQVNIEILGYVLSKRSIKVLAILLSAWSIGSATLVFQTITGNRILSPSILGLDSIYILFQLLAVMLIGRFSPLATNPYVNYIVTTILMCLFSSLLYQRVFSKKKSIFSVVLIGVVMGTFFSSITGMLQMIMDPDAYTMALDRLFASFNDVEEDLLLLSSIIVSLVVVQFYRNHHLLDVIALGKNYAVNLGIEYDKEVKKLLVMIFLLISVSTALVGPITFLGFFAVNITKTYLKTHKHRILIWGTVFMATITLLISQILVEHVFGFGLPISILISIFGGTYFIALLLRESAA